MDKQKVIQLQTFLKEKGYDLGPSGVDGIMGPKTKAAYEKAMKDGVFKSSNPNIIKIPSAKDRVQNAFDKPKLNPKTNTYSVKKGDTLSAIAKRNNMSLNELMRLNNISADKADYIQIGQKLILPSAKSSSKEATQQVVKQSTKQSAKQLSKKPSAENTFTPIYKPVVCNTPECAEYANLAVEQNLNNTIDLAGHAWTRDASYYHDSSKPMYEKYIMTGYTVAPTNRGNKQGWSDAKIKKVAIQRNKDAANRLKEIYDVSKLDPNRIYSVNMFYGISPNYAKAYNEGKGNLTGTHTGNLYNDGTRWLVDHNIHGKRESVPIEKFLGYSDNRTPAITEITPIVMPKQSNVQPNFENQNSFISDFAHTMSNTFQKKVGGKLIKKAQNGTYFDPNQSELDTVEISALNESPQFFKQKGVNSKLGKQFINSINNNRNYFMKTYDLSDQQYLDLAKQAVNTAQMETQLGDDLKQQFIYHAFKAAPNLYDKGYKTFLNIEYGDNAPGMSRGLTKIKYSDDIKNPELKKIYDRVGVTEHGIEGNPHEAALATIAKLHYNNTKKDFNSYRYNDGTFIPKENAQYMYWNFGRLSDNKNDNPYGQRIAGTDTVSARAKRFDREKIY